MSDYQRVPKPATMTNRSPDLYPISLLVCGVGCRGGGTGTDNIEPTSHTKLLVQHPKLFSGRLFGGDSSHVGRATVCSRYTAWTSHRHARGGKIDPMISAPSVLESEGRVSTVRRTGPPNIRVWAHFLLFIKQEVVVNYGGVAGLCLAPPAFGG